MNVAQRKRFVSRELVALAAQQPQAFGALCEQQYRERIDRIAEEVLASGRVLKKDEVKALLQQA